MVVDHPELSPTCPATMHKSPILQTGHPRNPIFFYPGVIAEKKSFPTHIHPHHACTVALTPSGGRASGVKGHTHGGGVIAVMANAEGGLSVATDTVLGLDYGNRWPAS